MTDIDKFVEYLILELCQGCTECEPRLSDDWTDVVCLNQGKAKWLMEMAERFIEKQEEV